jgi:hypothetical protein
LKELRGAEPKEIEQIGVETNDAAAYALIEVRIQSRPTAQHSVHELANPTSISCVESRRAPVENRIEQITRAYIGADLRGRDTRVRHPTHSMLGDPAGSRMLLRPWHTS